MDEWMDRWMSEGDGRSRSAIAQCDFCLLSNAVLCTPLIGQPDVHVKHTHEHSRTHTHTRKRLETLYG